MHSLIMPETRSKSEIMDEKTGAKGPVTGVCSYVQKHVIDALEGFSQFLANILNILNGNI